MKHSKIFAVTIAALFCLGALPLFAVEDASVSGEEPILNKGAAWGLSYELKYSDIEPIFSEALIAQGVDGAENGFDAYLDSMMMKELSESYDIDKAGLDLDFKIMEAILIEVADATENGYKVDYLFGLIVEVSADVSAEGKFPKAGTYADIEAFTGADFEKRSVYTKVSMFMKFTISGTIDFTKEGAITGLSIDLGMKLSGGIKTNMDLNFDIDAYDVNDDAEIVISYKDRDYNMSFDLNTSMKLSFNGTGLVLIPFDLKEGTTNVDTAASFDSISMTGNIKISNDAKGLIDQFIGKEGSVDSILTQTNNGKIDLKMDANTLSAMNNALALMPLKYTVDIAKNNDAEYNISISDPFGSFNPGNGGLDQFMNGNLSVGADLFYGDALDLENGNEGGFTLESFSWDMFLSADMFVLLAQMMPDGIMEIVDGDQERFAELRKSMTMASLDEDGRSKVRSTFSSIQDYNEDDDNLLIYAGIGVAAVVAIAIVFFLLRRF